MKAENLQVSVEQSKNITITKYSRDITGLFFQRFVFEFFIYKNA